MDAPTPMLTGLAFVEAPRWHAGELWFSDFYTHEVRRIDAAGQVHTVVEVPNQPSGLGWTPDGRLLVVSMLDRRLLRLDPCGLVEVADLSPWAPCHCNDMVVDAEGRAYIGNFGFDLMAGAKPQPTVLLRVDPDGRVEAAADGLMFPNGCVITPDGSTLIVAETFGQRLSAFCRAGDGSLSERRVWADLPGIGPDGICLDAEGAVWVASPRTNQFVRVHEGGRISARIAIDQQAIACALGGDDGRTLFMLSGQVLPAEAALAARCARIDRMRVEIAAAG